MQIKHYEYKPLAHYSYAIVSDGKMAVIDPERDPMQYYAFAEENDAQIIAVIQTHPHADFVSSHLQIHEETGATIYNSEKLGAEYPHEFFDEGSEIKLGKISLKARNTPGHSPDSITIVATEGDETALFTGDTLFIGDVGRPDLREKAGAIMAKRQELAEMMYDSIQNKFTDLPDDALVYPAHGAGSLCGKNLSSDNSSTLGNERMGNWAFKEQTQEEFVNTLLDSQPFIPSYFGFDVDINKAGAKNVRTALGNVKFAMAGDIEEGAVVVDVRPEEKFKKEHFPGSFNIQVTSENSKFETWLGAIIEPKEKFFLVIDKAQDLEMILERTSKIGYEAQVEAVVTLAEAKTKTSAKLDVDAFAKNTEDFTIVDIRNESEINDGKFFESAEGHPLNELRKTYKDIPTDKPIVVHCAGGYRSAAGSSILERLLPDATVYDLSDAVERFK